jgi:hypothetical protein
MTLLFFDGCFEGSVQVRPDWAGVWGGTNQVGRDGTTAGAAAAVNGGVNTLTLPTPATTCIVGCGIFVNNSGVLGNTTLASIPWQFFRGATLELVAVINSSGFIEVRRSSATGTLLGTTSGHSPITATPGPWFHVAFKVVLHSSAGSVVVQVNGVTVLTVTGAATAGTTGDVTKIAFGNGSNAGSNRIWWDDIYVLDGVDDTATSGRADNDFLGDVKVAALIPAANGDSSQWTCSTGTNHAALVDESPPNTTDYVTDSVSGHLDLNTLGDLSGTAQAVYAVQQAIYAAADDAGAIGVKPSLKENSTVTDQATQTLTGTTYGIKYAAMLKNRPSDGGQWSVSDVNALQAGVKVA